jgi:ATP-dependent DNA helicase RecG
MEEANGLVHAALSMFADGPEYLRCEFLRTPQARLILWFTIQKTPYVVKTASGEVYRRQNASDRQLQGSELTRLELDKGVHSAENQRLDACLDELDGSSVGRMFVDHIVPTMDLKTFVNRERFAIDGFLRLGAALLFLDYPQPLVPYASVKIYRYKSLELEGDREDLAGDPVTIEGSLYEQIRASVAKIKEIIEDIPILSSSGLREIKYPDEAIHEVICNAILHRDYSIHDYVHVRIFDNRVEVESPGRFAGHITALNIILCRLSCIYIFFVVF